MPGKEGKTPVQKTVTREGKTHQQTFWVKLDQMSAHRAGEHASNTGTAASHQAASRAFEHAQQSRLSYYHGGAHERLADRDREMERNRHTHPWDR